MLRIILALLLLSSCSSVKLVNRAVKKDPDVLQNYIVKVECPEDSLQPQVTMSSSPILTPKQEYNLEKLKVKEAEKTERDRIAEQAKVDKAKNKDDGKTARSSNRNNRKVDIQESKDQGKVGKEVAKRDGKTDKEVAKQDGKSNRKETGADKQVDKTKARQEGQTERFKVFMDKFTAWFSILMLILGVVIGYFLRIIIAKVKKFF